MTVSEFIYFSEILSWPLTFLAVIIIFKPYLANTFDRLSSIQAGSSGFSFNFENAPEKAKESFEAIKPRVLETSKSATHIAFTKVYVTPYDQLVSIKKSLDQSNIKLAAKKEFLLKEYQVCNSSKHSHRPESFAKKLLIHYENYCPR